MTAGVARRALGNGLALTLGRGGVALLRLAIAALIVRASGAATFGEYALLFGLLAIAEWVLDSGTHEIAVREICGAGHDDAARARWLRALMWAKLVQVPAAALLLLGLVGALQYPPHLLAAAAAGACGLVFSAAAGACRVAFKAELRMAREMQAEFASVVVMLGLAALVLHADPSPAAALVALMGCHAASRAVFASLCLYWGGRGARHPWRGLRRDELVALARAAAPIGLIGLLVALYEALDTLLLSKLGSAVELGWYAAAQRIVWPLLMALAAVGATLYPLAAGLWPRQPERFGQACQTAVDTVLLLAGGATVVAWAAAEGLLALLGPGLGEGAAAVRALALLVLAKAIAGTLGPVLYVVHAQRQALVFIAVAVVAKAAAVLSLVPLMGWIGVAVAALVVELLFATGPTLWLLQRRSGWRLRWGIPLRLLGATALTLVAAPAFVGLGTADPHAPGWPALATAALSLALYLLMAVASRAWQPRRLLASLQRPPREAAP